MIGHLQSIYLKFVKLKDPMIKMMDIATVNLKFLVKKLLEKRNTKATHQSNTDFSKRLMDCGINKLLQ